MGLTSSMWSSVSGLISHGERMNIVGNNIANVNTVGFKNQRMDFQDFVYQSIGTAGGPAQVGRGVSVGAIMNDFSQGAFETSTRSTDIAIEGNGFFMVKPSSSTQSYYTRAGNFAFDKDGNLVDPHGYILQGWSISAENKSRTSSGIVGDGAVTDVKLDTFTCPPRHTSTITVPVNLPNAKDASSDDRSSDADNPFFSLLKRWDATQTTPLAATAYAAQTTMVVYDEGGREHTLSIYFDRVANKNPATIDGYADNETYWEYIITMDPSEDMRDFSSRHDSAMPRATSPDVPDKLKGLLGAGTLTFSSSGLLKDMTAFVPHTDGSDVDHWWTTSSTGEVNVDLNKWIASPFDATGYPVFAPNFTGGAGLSQAYQDGNWSQPNANASGLLISLDFGLRSTSSAWQFQGDPSGNVPDTYKTSGLPTAAGMSQAGTAQAQKTGKYEGMYIWETTNSQYTILTQKDVKPTFFDNVWGKASPAHNGTQFTWRIPSLAANNITYRGGQALPLEYITETDTTPNPVFTIDDKNPNNAVFHTYTATGNAQVTAQIYRSGSGEILTPAEFDKYMTENNMAWTRSASGVPAANLVTYTANDSSGSTIVCPDSMSLNDVRALTWGAGQPDPAYTHDYYIMTVPGAKPSTYEVQVPRGNTPTATANLWKHDVTETYWYNGANPDIILVNTNIPSNQTLNFYVPPVTTNGTIPTATAKMEGTNNANKYFLNGLDGLGETQATASTCQGDSYYEINGYKQDGYTSGSLYNVSVNSNGVLSGYYSNGVTLQLYQLTLYDFPSTQNLRREGGNLFSETRESGIPSHGAAGTGSFGTTHGNSIEQSNVDLASEFVNMIVTQRGFQANSKAITTIDTMLETVISMKR